MAENSEAVAASAGLSVEAGGVAVQRVLEGIQVGGPVVAILIAMSVAAVAVALAKLWQFAGSRIGDLRPAYEALSLYQVGRSEAAVDRGLASPNPVAQTVARAIHGQWRGLPEDKVREEALRFGGDALEALRSRFRLLEVIGTLAPLLGLFGTVLGMIEAFQQLEAAGNRVNPAVLSGGIWEALLTTAVGLAVAIPTVALLNWFERRVDRLAHEMDSVVTRVFTTGFFAGFEGEASNGSARGYPGVYAAAPGE